jgi:hypothetical protein
MKTRIMIGFLLVAAAAACSSGGEDEGGDINSDVGEVNAGGACKDLKTLSTCERNPKCDWVTDTKCAGTASSDNPCLKICVDAPK